MKTFEEFKEAMKDEAFRKEMVTFMEEKKPADKAAEIEAIVAFAANKGFAVTVEELGQEMAGSRELSDDEIENVIGGEIDWDWCMLDDCCIKIDGWKLCSGVVVS